VDDALRTARDAGIQTVIVTGDHPHTAATVATSIGLPGSSVVVGAELDGWDDPQLRRRLASLEVVARAVPEQKLRLVDAARAAGRTVAVTGDGVNDAPALQRADVAVSMGSGSAVAREASDLVLGDDSFATLMYGLAEGRRIVANVQKGLVFLVSTHIALLGFILLATIAGFDQPLLPIQILWLELFIDISASVAFEREPLEPDAMRRPPRPPGRPLLTRALLLRITGAGGFTALAALVLLVSHHGGDEHARWLAFDALVLGQAVRAYANRSLDHPVSRLPVNRFLASAAILAVAIQLAIPYVPVLADAFRATPVSAGELGLVAVIALTPAAVGELLRARGIRPWVA
jgi:Ca2+-transporting ATPase